MTYAAISDSVERGFDSFFEWLPALLGALAILVIGYLVAKVVSAAIHRLLHRGGLDRSLTQGQAGTWVSKLTSSPSHLIGRIAFWALFLGAISLAVSTLGIDALESLIAAIYSYLPHVIAALAIFLIASAIAAGLATLIARTMGDTPTGRVLATVAPGLVMAIAVFMILTELQVAETIVTITFAALIGSLALAAALAFGLGGRDVASRMLESAYEKGQESREQVRQDLRQGKERAQEDMQKAKDKKAEIEGDSVSGPPSRDTERETVRIAPPTSGTTGAGATTSGATTIGEGGRVGRTDSPGGGEPDVERVPARELDDVPPGSADDVTRR